jgi:putative transposase
LSYYHVISRVIERRFALDRPEKERFRKLMRQIESFTGVRVLTYAILDNHVHLLLEVDIDARVSDKEVIRRVHDRYGKATAMSLGAAVREARKGGTPGAVDALLGGYRLRMNALSFFMKDLLHLYTQAYNRRHQRRGTLWEGRFKSMLVEGQGEALSMIAAYIDLNAVRAGIVNDPKDYLFCGYGEASAGSEYARDGIRTILKSLGQTIDQGWGDERYRELLHLQGITHGKGGAAGKSFKKQAAKVLEEGGELSKADLLRCRVRYFSDGVVLGGKVFVQDTFLAHRDQFGLKRRTGPRKMRNTATPGLFTMRDLRLTPIAPSD